MSSIYEAKEFLEQGMLIGSSGCNDTRTFVNESLEKAYSQSGLSGFGGCYSDEAVIGAGILADGRLEVAIDQDWVRHGAVCHHFGAQLSRKTMIPHVKINVVPTPRAFAYRKVKVGDKVGHGTLARNRAFGSLGLFLLDVDGTGKNHFRSNNHVLAATNAAKIGDKVYLVEDEIPAIGELKKYVKIYRDTPNHLDLALATFSGARDGHYDAIRGYRKPRLGEWVRKRGATTGETLGQVRSVEYTKKISYDGGTAVFQNQLQIVSGNGRPFSLPGDSGSGIFSRSDGAFVGLLFAGNGEWTMANHADVVIKQLQDWGLKIG